MPEARIPFYHYEVGTTTLTAKMPVLSTRKAKRFRTYLYKGPNVPVEFLDDEELVVVVEDGYVLSRAGG